jgi:cruciform cutting endonuclease 1
MAKKQKPVTAKALQALLVRIGSASSGTKDVLRERLKRDVSQSNFNLRCPNRGSQKEQILDRKLRIVSIDMGIKNLAYCDASVDYTNGNLMEPKIDIIRWNKVNLVDATRDLRWERPQPSLVEEEAAEKTEETEEEVDPYSLSVLSKTAHRFVRSTILSAEPDIILIERQRWRSSSSTAIQQWTVRVNTVEAMLWAALETILSERQTQSPSNKGVTGKRGYQVFAVDPKRVGQYWLVQHAKAVAEERDESMMSLALEDLVEDEKESKSRKKLPRSKAEKKAKIALVRKWLSTEPASTAQSTPVSAPLISFGFGPGAEMAREALRPRSRKAPKPRKKKGNTDEDEIKAVEDDGVREKDIMKLDDITDCCLQVAAWVAWESNRIQLENVLVGKQGSAGRLLELDEEILKEMLAVSGED